MRHIMISAPIIAASVAGISLVAGMGWLVSAVLFFLSAPVVLILAYVICTHIVACAPDANQDTSITQQQKS